MINDMIETRRSARPWGQHVGIEALGENTPPAQNGPAIEPTSSHHEANRTPGDRQVSQPSMIPAMHPDGSRPTPRTNARGLAGAHGDQRARAVVRDLVDDEAARDESRGAKGLGHGSELPR